MPRMAVRKKDNTLGKADSAHVHLSFDKGIWGLLVFFTNFSEFQSKFALV